VNLAGVVAPDEREGEAARHPGRGFFKERGLPELTKKMLSAN
jgi:hypothetical protein